MIGLLKRDTAQAAHISELQHYLEAPPIGRHVLQAGPPVSLGYSRRCMTQIARVCLIN